MKILFLSDDFPPKSNGGAGIITAELAAGISNAGHNVHVITTVQVKDNSGIRMWNGVTVNDIYVDYFQKLSTYISIINPLVLNKVEEIIRDIKPEIIHAHNIHNYLSYHCLKIANKYTDKVFLTTHDAMAFNYGKLVNFYNKNDLSVQKKFCYKVNFWQNVKTAKKRYNPLRNILIRYYINKFVKRVFAISDRLKEALIQNGIKNVETIHYGIDYKRWVVSEYEKNEFASKIDVLGSKVILFGGRLSQPKGGQIMIEVLKMIVENNNKVKLLIAGTPNGYSDYLMNYAEKLGIKRNIVFTGWLSREDMKKAYAVCDVCVTPSIYFDAFNLFNIEAGASKKPVIGTCFGGTPEIIQNDVSGIIINPNNREMFRDAINQVIDDENLAKRLGDGGYKRVREYFSMDRFVKEHLDRYQD